jgi:hypothetical protein
LEPFWIFSKIRGDIRELMLITGVNDTGDKLFSGVNDTGDKFFAGVVDTGEQFIFPQCGWYRSEKTKKLIAGVNDTAQKLFTFVAVSTTPLINFLAVWATPAIRESCQY